MTKDYRVYLLDILDYIDIIDQMIVNDNWDLKTRLSVEPCLTIIGEAARRIPEDVKYKYSDTPWQKINGLRNLLIREYEDIELDIIKDICKHHLHPLSEQLKLLCD